MKDEMGENGLDRQIDRLTGELREKGSKPERDLWPEIEEAIRRSGPETGSSGWISVWRMAALAAVLALAVGLGRIGTGDGRGSAGNAPAGAESAMLPPAPEGDSPAMSDFQEVSNLDRALRQLNRALASDPGNPGLSRLVRNVHKYRAEALSRKTRLWNRL